MNKKIALYLGFGSLFLAVVILSLLVGSGKISVAQIFSVLGSRGNDLNSTIIWGIRIPRIILSIFVGIGLSLSGCIFQNILRNPLADPYTLGISGGAALGTTLGIVTNLAAVSIAFLPICAFAGAFVSIILVYFISANRKFSNHVMILSGVILGFVFSAMVLLIFSLVSADKIQSALMWLLGDLSSADTLLTAIVGVVVVLGGVLIAVFSRDLDILMLGDEKALSLGLNPGRVRAAFFITASLITAACVSASGIIGFVGLIIPHFVRKLAGNNHLNLVLLSSIVGATFLTLCDTLSRTIIAPIELPVGVITGILGGIFLLIFLLKGDESL